MKFITLLLSIVTLALFSSCDQDEKLLTSPIDLLSDTYDNIPVKVNTTNSFTFTVSAKDFTYSTEDNLIFDADSLVYTLTLMNSKSSNSSVQLIDSAGNQIFNESLNTNKVIVNPNIKGVIPKKIIIDLINFSGQLTIVVAIDNS